MSPIRHVLDALVGPAASAEIDPPAADSSPMLMPAVSSRVRAAFVVSTVAALSAFALLSASCGSLDTFSLPTSAARLAGQPHVLHSPLAPQLTLSAPVWLPGEYPVEPLFFAPEPILEPAPEPAPEPTPEVALPGLGGTPFIPKVERWRGTVRELIAEARAEGRLPGAASVINEDLVLAIIQQESGGDPNAESWAGARGLMQLMPESFAWIMLGRRWGSSLADVDPTFPFDPSTNLRAGIRFLGAVLEEQGGSIYWALASYNAGGGAVNSWRAAGHTSIPAYGGYWETAAYAPAILSNYEAHRAQG